MCFLIFQAKEAADRILIIAGYIEEYGRNLINEEEAPEDTGLVLARKFQMTGLLDGAWPASKWRTLDPSATEPHVQLSSKRHQGPGRSSDRAARASLS